MVNDAAIRAVLPQGSKLFMAHGSEKRGGVAVWINRKLADAVELIGVSRAPIGMESVWLRIKGHALCLKRRNLLIGACYAAPVSSKLYSPPGRRPGVSPPERVFGQLKALVQRYQSTDDELVILGDLNARVAKLRELPDAEADAELEIVAQAVVGSAGLLRGIPDRSCRDTENNAFGRSLVELCKEMELVILNGRVEGDLQGELTFWHKNGLGKSMIDLFITTPGLYYKAAELRVLSVPMASTGPRASDLMSDHCPVYLALQVLSGPGKTHARNQKAARFDTKRWPKYAKAFERDDASTLRSIGSRFREARGGR